MNEWNRRFYPRQPLLATGPQDESESARDMRLGDEMLDEGEVVPPSDEERDAFAPPPNEYAQPGGSGGTGMGVDDEDDEATGYSDGGGGGGDEEEGDEESGQSSSEQPPGKRRKVAEGEDDLYSVWVPVEGGGQKQIMMRPVAEE